MNNYIEKKYYENGKIEQEIPHLPGGTTSFIDGIQKNYDENGNLSSEYHFKMGKPFLYKIFYPSGKLGEEGACEGLPQNRNGFAKGYYESGKLKNEINYKNGKKDGIEKGFYETGEKEYDDLFIGLVSRFGVAMGGLKQNTRNTVDRIDMLTGKE